MRFAIVAMMVLLQEPVKPKEEFKADEAFALGWQVLKEEGKTKDWRPDLGKRLDVLLKLLGDAPGEKVRERAPRLRIECLDEGHALVTKNQDEIKESAAVLVKAKGKEFERRSVLVCDSGEFEKMKECVVLCMGDLKVRELERAIVLARGKVTIGRRAAGCLIYAGGRITSDDEIEDCTLLAEGGVEIKNDSEENVFVNTPERKIGSNKKGDDKEVTIPGLPGKKK